MENFRKQQLNYGDFAPSDLSDDFEVAPRPGRVSLSRPLAKLVLRTPQSTVCCPPAPYLVQWLQSGGNLDFCLLAVCSCLLTLLCHQTATLLSTSTATSSSAVVSSSPARSAEMEFFLKAALFQSFPEIEKQSQEMADRLKQL